MERQSAGKACSGPGAAIPRAEVPGTEAAQLALQAARTAAAANEPGRVAEWAERGLSHHPPAEIRAQLLAYLGTAVAMLGDTPRAARCLRQALHLSTGAGPVPSMHPAVAANLGNVYAHLNRRAPAAVMFHLAASIYWREGRRQDELRCHLEAAWMLLLAGDHRTAAHDLEAASDLLHGHGGQDQVIRHRIATALHAYLAGDHLTAEETTIDLVQHSDLDHSQAADAAWLLSLLAYRKGDEGAGRRCAELAYEQALVGWDPLQLDRIAGLINEQRDPGGACLPDIAGKARHH